MGWNGSGQFTRTDGTRTGTEVWQDARDAGVNIRADDHDTHDEDIADGIENTVALDGQNTTTSDNAILRYDTGQSAFVGAAIGASEVVGRSSTGDTRGLSATTARKVLGVASADSPNFGGVAISSTQWGYLGGLGSAPLEDDDLAANGGDVTTEGNQNVFTTRQEIKAGSALQFRTDRDDSGSHWDILRNGGLIARVEATSGNIRWRAEGGSVANEFWTNSTRRGYFDPDGGFVMDGATGGSQGSGTVNGTLYDNSNRVYSASNAPASTALSDHASAVVNLGGDFASDEVRCERIGNWVTISPTGPINLTTSSSFGASTTGAIPSQFRPTGSTIQNAFHATGTTIRSVTVQTDGTLSVFARNWDSTNANVSSYPGFSLSYLIT